MDETQQALDRSPPLGRHSRRRSCLPWGRSTGARRRGRGQRPPPHPPGPAPPADQGGSDRAGPGRAGAAGLQRGAACGSRGESRSGRASGNRSSSRPTAPSRATSRSSPGNAVGARRSSQVWPRSRASSTRGSSSRRTSSSPRQRRTSIARTSTPWRRPRSSPSSWKPESIDAKDAGELLGKNPRQARRLLQLHGTAAPIKRAVVRGQLDARIALEMVRIHNRFVRQDESAAGNKALQRIERLIERYVSEAWTMRKLERFAAKLDGKTNTAPEEVDDSDDTHGKLRAIRGEWTKCRAADGREGRWQSSDGPDRGEEGAARPRPEADRGAPTLPRGASLPDRHPRGPALQGAQGVGTENLRLGPCGPTHENPWVERGRARRSAAMRRHFPSKKCELVRADQLAKSERRPPSRGRLALAWLTPRSKKCELVRADQQQFSEEREVKPAPEGALPGGQDWGQGQWQGWGQGKSRNPAKFAPRPRHPRGAVNPRNDVPSARPLSPNHWGEGSGRWHQGEEPEMGGGARAGFGERGRTRTGRVEVGSGVECEGWGNGKSWSNGIGSAGGKGAIDQARSRA